MYKIKQIPEDFVVKEINHFEFKEGNYGYFLLEKRELTTHEAVEEVAKIMNVPSKSIGFAGNKDKQAITFQYISIKDRFSVPNFKSDRIKLRFEGKSNTPLSLGELDGNKFEIVIRNIEKPPKKLKQFVNYFDEQRFSTNNAQIGETIVKKEYKKALELIFQGKGREERYSEEFYIKTKDPIGALKRIPKKIVKMYVHAYQSKIWNEMAEEISKTAKKNISLPLIGFETEIKDKKIKELAEKILNKEQITQRDFLIRSYPEISSEGSSRMLYAEVKNLKIGKLEKNDLGEGKKVKIYFSLGKGSYATMLIKNLF